MLNQRAEQGAQEPAVRTRADHQDVRVLHNCWQYHCRSAPTVGRVAAYRIVSQNIDSDAGDRPGPELCTDAGQGDKGTRLERLRPAHDDCLLEAQVGSYCAPSQLLQAVKELGLICWNSRTNSVRMSSRPSATKTPTTHSSATTHPPRNEQGPQHAPPPTGGHPSPLEQ